MKAKKGAGPSLTWILMSVAAFVAIIVLSLQGYNDILTQNNITPDSAIMANYSAIAGKQADLNNASAGFSDLSLGSVIQVGITLFQSLVGFGFSAIQNLVQGTKIVRAIVDITASAYPEAAMVFWFATFVIVIYVASRFIKVIRQDSEEA